jgi:hypothetical protein
VALPAIEAPMPMEAAAPPAVESPFAERTTKDTSFPVPAPVAAMRTEDLVEAVAERVLAQLDPYIIEKISKEIVRPIVEEMIRHELRKLS